MRSEILAAVNRISNLASEKKAEDIVIIDVEGICSYTDALIVCHGRSNRQTQSIASYIQEMMKREGHKLLGLEGEAEGHWILMDYGDVVVHIFYEPVRAYYDLEGIWPEAKKIASGE